MGSTTNQPFVYVGTYTSENNAGIYTFSLDTSTGAMHLVGTVEGDTNPSYLTIHPSKHYLYAVNEVDTYNAVVGGAISAYTINWNTGQLTLINRQPTLSKGPCHISTDPLGSYCLVANYGGGAITVLRVQENGGLTFPTHHVQHEESEVVNNIPKPPHVHSTLPDPSGRFIIAADLGLDKLVVYALDSSKGQLVLQNDASTVCRPGSGPRHFKFHPNGKFLYVINELDSTLSVFVYNADSGIGDEIQTVAAVPASFLGSSWCADIHIHPNGRFLYGSNRGHDSLVIYLIDATTGLLTQLGHSDTQGKWPRSFTLDATGTLLLVANEHSNNLASYWVDQATGMLRPTGYVVAVPKPASVVVAGN